MGQNWLIGITGGIAAYKMPQLIRHLKKRGDEVRVVLSKGAHAFVTPMTLQAISGHPVYSELLDTDFEAAMGHIELARWAQGILIAPLSANRLAALALGISDDLLTTLCLATSAPIWVAPAMNRQMWEHPATQGHIHTLQQRGITIIGPAWGEQACGETGWGRLLEPENIVQQLHTVPAVLLDKTVLITAGPTQEPLDPVRFLSNHSSGKMGFALAQAAKAMGARVILIAGPVVLPTPYGVERIDVITAQEMHEAVMSQIKGIDIFISAAAVCDFKVKQTQPHKIKKQQLSLPWQIELVENPDILAQVARLSKRPFCVGFAAETQDSAQNARHKLVTKQIDMIAMNEVNRHDIGFNANDNELTVFTENTLYPLSKAPKYQIALALLELISEHYHEKNTI